MKTFIIIPVYNESCEVVRKTISGIINHFPNIVLVDDGNEGNNNLKEGLSDLPVYYVKHFLNLGQGAALQTGVELALFHGAEIIIHFDADGQHHLEDLPLMVDAVKSGQADIVLGSRFLRKEDILRVPPFRRKVLKLATFINWAFTGLKLTDAHNGLRVMNKKSASRIVLTENRQAHATQILTKIKRNKLKYIELPCTVTYSEYSLTKGQSVFNMFGIFIDLTINSIYL